MNYSFDVGVATEYGVNEAIVIGNFQFWLMKNKANNVNVYDGRTWTYNSTQAFTALFPFWTVKQIRRVLDSLIKQGVIMTGNYNKSAYDRTLWYGFVDESKWLNGIFQTEKSKSPNEEIDLPKRANGNDQKGEPIPDINTDNKPDRKPDNKPDISLSSPRATKQTVLLESYGITGDLAHDFAEHRKAKKAAITKTALEGFQREADKAGIDIAEAVRISIERNWQGFNASWDWQPQKSPGAATNNNRGLKQPPEYPDYSVLWEGDNSIDSTAEIITDEPKRL